MDDSDLFDVFDVDNNPEPIQNAPTAPLERQKSQKHKSKGPSKQESNGVVAIGKRAHDKRDGDDAEGKMTVKKARKNIEDPIVVDSFETESEQIVPATTGLQGTAPTDAKIIIKKRVNLRNLKPGALPEIGLVREDVDGSTAMRLCFPRRIGNILPWKVISSLIRLREYTPSNSIPFKRCLLPRSKEMKVFSLARIQVPGKPSLQNTPLQRV